MAKMYLIFRNLHIEVFNAQEYRRSPNTTATMFHGRAFTIINWKSSIERASSPITRRRDGQLCGPSPVKRYQYPAFILVNLI